MKSIEQAIASDFLSHFSKVKTLSQYSPKASLIAYLASRSYPAEGGGNYYVSTANVIEAAEKDGVIVKLLPNGDAQIGVSAEQLSKRRSNSVFSDGFVCRHAFAPYSYIISISGEPKQVACCPRCKNGIESPSEFEIKQAEAYLAGRASGTTPLGGAMILAARRTGCTIIRNLNGKYEIKRLQSTPITTSINEAG